MSGDLDAEILQFLEKLQFPVGAHQVRNELAVKGYGYHSVIWAVWRLLALVDEGKVQFKVYKGGGKVTILWHLPAP